MTSVPGVKLTARLVSSADNRSMGESAAPLSRRAETRPAPGTEPNPATPTLRGHPHDQHTR